MNGHKDPRLFVSNVGTSSLQSRYREFNVLRGPFISCLRVQMTLYILPVLG